MQEYKIITNVDDSDEFDVAESLGINMERGEEIENIVDEVVSTTDTWLSAYEKVLNRVQPKDTMEGFFIGLIIGRTYAEGI